MPNSRDVHQLAKYVLGWQALLKLAKVERNNIFKDGEGEVDKESEGTRTANHHICYLLTPLRSSGKPYEYEILLHLLATSYGGRSSLVVMVCFCSGLPEFGKVETMKLILPSRTS